MISFLVETGKARRISWVATGIALAAMLAAHTAPAARARGSRIVGSCTMAVPPTRATVEVQIANAADFCELVSHALSGDVFHAPLLVTPGRLWHYAGATVSCRLRYGDTRYRMTIRNSAAACRWLMRLAPSWRVEAAGTE